MRQYAQICAHMPILPPRITSWLSMATNIPFSVRLLISRFMVRFHGGSPSRINHLERFRLRAKRALGGSWLRLEPNWAGLGTTPTGVIRARWAKASGFSPALKIKFRAVPSTPLTASQASLERLRGREEGGRPGCGARLFGCVPLAASPHRLRSIKQIK